jgi:hypothetical protein
MKASSLRAFFLRTAAAGVIALGFGCDVKPFCLDGCDGVDGSVADGGTERDGGPPRDVGPLDQGVCVPTEDGVEECNALDDDCDGTFDEGFDLARDPRHCGVCGNECRFANAEGSCVESECVVGECSEGFVDLDGEPGCEYACPVFPTQAEDCNGFDDDCDGVADEPDELPAPPAGLCRTTPGTLCADVRPVCETREGRGTWFCDYPEEVEHDPLVPNGIALEETRCDGFDGDCDGLADEPFETLGDECDNGERGACRDAGRVSCDPADASRTFCDLTVLPDAVPGAPFAVELCNGIDDDCDGTIDDATPGDPSRVIDDMVHVVRGGLDFYIYRHEASRPDATTDEGGRSDARACGREGVMPWTTVGLDAAAAACAAGGHRLCTSAEWQAACEGASATAFPYGVSYEAASCNGADRDAIPGGAIESRMEPTGALAMCESEYGVLDLSGNVKEWTNDPRGVSEGGAAIYVVRGGSFESPSFGLTCQTDLSRATVDTLLPSIGFRCCRDDAP